MDEYIRREDVIEWFMPYAHAAESIDADVVISDIKGMKAADVAPVRHGRWIRESDGGTRCSVCNKQVRDVTGGGDAPVDLSDMPYCPKCGANMDGCDGNSDMA